MYYALPMRPKAEALPCSEMQEVNFSFLATSGSYRFLQIATATTGYYSYYRLIYFTTYIYYKYEKLLQIIKCYYRILQVTTLIMDVSVNAVTISSFSIFTTVDMILKKCAILSSPFVQFSGFQKVRFSVFDALYY